MNLKKIGKVFTSKSVGTGPSSYKKRIYRTAVSQRLRNTACSPPTAAERQRIGNRPSKEAAHGKESVTPLRYWCGTVQLVRQVS